MLQKIETGAIEEIFFPSGRKTANDIQENLPDYIVQILKKQNNLNIITDKIIYRKKNAHREYDSLIITKFLTPSFQLADCLSNIISLASGRINIFVDFDFMIECSKDEDSPYKFEFGSKTNAMNSQMKIFDKSDAEQFCNEFRTKDYADILNECYINHNNLNDYSSSGFKPHQLLSMKLYMHVF